MKSLSHDVWVALKHAIFLPLIFFGRHMLSKSSELWGPKEKAPDGDSGWFFINGIMTNEEQASDNAARLSELFGRPVTVIHNPTKGLISDLAECVRQRTLDETDDVIRRARDTLLAALRTRHKVVVIAHSQGTIILASVLRLLNRDAWPLMRKLEAYTFAGAFDEFPNGTFYAEHFWNRLDYVARIGIGEIRPTCGTDYSAWLSGHFLNAHYLPHFKAGRYCGGKSRLFGVLAAK